ncbi:hypothetical protein FB451DRAFT_1400757 [Mycena latifolia]|nr:hypothetical protein FB451DRAFT_1400757 [Mycena latifolia]
MSTNDGYAASLTAVEDKALKREAIRSKGEPVTRKLDLWLSSYLPGPPSGPRRANYYEQRRAELLARKKRVEALMELRARALRESARRWPKMRQAREEDNRVQAKRVEEARRAARIAIEAKEARAAADARVASLMALRFAGGKRRIGGRK